MILVVTLNPALDVTHHVDEADWSGVNRPHEVHVRAGGKGLNVARTLHALGQPVTVTGLAGGCTGQALAAGLVGAGISADLTAISGETRRTFVVADSARGQTALFNEPGPAVSDGEYRAFAARFEQAVRGAVAVVLSGSLPPGVPEDAYAGLTASAVLAGVPVILDASGDPLRLGAAAGPALIKPNLAELEAAAGRELRAGAEPDLPAIEQAAGELAAAGPGNAAVVVSLGAAGLLATGPDGTWHARPPGHVEGNPTGAGDAVVAGLADSLVRGYDWPSTLRHAAALGSSAAGAPAAGEFAPADYERLVTTVEVVGAAAGRRGEPR
jgi:1-phosphofructokinase family hexose kinase